ncbi:MAG TPA: DUF222 domain-containing protein [Actinomycetota bacterium]|nr:DUF222 domain-containing protein [Actinomycetota bacterium]
MQSPQEAPLAEQMDACHVRACAAHRQLLGFIAGADRRELWRGDGARDMAHWLWMRYGMSEWKARRWIVAAYALENLPLTASGLESGELGIDKAVELCRFATPETEEGLLSWATRVSAGAIRRKGDLEATRTLAETRELERSRSLRVSYDDEGRRCDIEVSLPAAEGRMVEAAIEARRRTLPVMPGEEGDADAHRADALVALCTGGFPERTDEATVVVHASLEAMATGEGSASLESGGVIHAETARRLGCSGRVQVVVEDESGEPIRLGRTTRDPSAAMLRLLRHKDPGCVFPGCGSRSFTHAHHISWWSTGGRTDLDNLAIVCTFHHRLVHEHGWRLTRDRGELRWFRPEGTRYLAGPERPQGPIEALPRGQPALPVAGV